MVTHLDSAGWYAALTSIRQIPFGPVISTKPDTTKVPLGAGADACFQFLSNVFLKAVDAVAISVLGIGSPGNGRKILARSEFVGSEDGAVVGTSGGSPSADGSFLGVCVPVLVTSLPWDRRPRLMYPGGNRGFSGSGLADLTLRKFLTLAIWDCQRAFWLAQNDETVAVGQSIACSRDTLMG